MEESTSSDKPKLYKHFFWEFKYEAIDWQRHYATVIERVIERGMEPEWGEIIRFYGKEKVIQTLIEEVNYLPNEIIKKVCRYFDLKPRQLKCYLRKQSLPRHWI
ncbi:DUF6922 domain-containing protein [Chryseolinea soli]|uniref:DUF6922 domain-containing protein n=1 Tax=Chryseolinea soli TaxID=2321403 RepID=A0A385SHV6_9BACT|nr:hypothetical protein [Chryseolinea soli]AYB31313.1 hypothetical protein D4L85_12310 [Chryseolinea soli]